MRNIAIFASGNAASTERIVNLFNEGNRLRTVLVVVSNSARDLLPRLEGKEVKLLHIEDIDWHKEIPEVEALMESAHIQLLVLDHFTLPVDDRLVKAAGGKILEVTTPELAPREVVAALEEDLRKPKVEKVIEVENSGEKTPEQEWADALKINFTPPPVPSTPPAVPSTPSDVPEKNEPVTQSEPSGINQPEEPMPSTYLIWSVLCTVFCCFIPGIIAIIFSSRVSSRYYAGDLEGAKKSSRMAEIWIIVSVVAGAVAGALYVPFMLLGN